MKCFDYALKYIHKYPKTEKELRIQLMQKGYFSSEIDNTIEEFKKKRWVDDVMFAESYIRSEVINKGKPIFRIIQKLRLKGIDQQILQKIQRDFEEDMNGGILKRIRKEIESYKHKDVEGFDIIQKLMRRGYKLNDIKHVINSSKT